MIKELKTAVKSFASFLYQVGVGLILFILTAALAMLIMVSVIAIAAGLVLSVAALMEGIAAGSLAVLMAGLNALPAALVAQFFATGMFEIWMLLSAYACAAGALMLVVTHEDTGLGNYPSYILKNMASTNGHYGFFRKIAMRLLLILGADINYVHRSYGGERKSVLAEVLEKGSEELGFAFLEKEVVEASLEKARFLMARGAVLCPVKTNDMTDHEYENLLDYCPLMLALKSEKYKTLFAALKNLHEDISPNLEIPAYILHKSLMSAIKKKNLGKARFLIGLGAELVPARPQGMSDAEYEHFIPLSAALGDKHSCFPYGQHPISIFKDLVDDYRLAHPDSPYPGVGILSPERLQQGLHNAVTEYNANSNVAELLMEHYKVDVSLQKSGGQNLLDKALVHDDSWHTVKSILKIQSKTHSCPVIEAHTVRKMLAKAIELKDSDFAQLLVRNYNVDINDKYLTRSSWDQTLITPVHKAQANHNTDMAIALIYAYKEAHPNSPQLQPILTAALKTAIDYNQGDLIERLIEAGADIEFATPQGVGNEFVSPLLCAMNYDNSYNITTIKKLIVSYRALHPEYAPHIPMKKIMSNNALFDYCIDQGFLAYWTRTEKIDLLEQLLLKKQSLREKDKTVLKTLLDSGVVFTPKEKGGFFARVKAEKEDEFTKSRAVFSYRNKYLFQHPLYLYGQENVLSIGRIPESVMHAFFGDATNGTNNILLAQNKDGTFHYWLKGNDGTIISGDTTFVLEQDISRAINFGKFCADAKNKEILNTIYDDIKLLQMLANAPKVVEAARQVVAQMEADYEQMIAPRKKMIHQVTTNALPDYLQTAASENYNESPLVKGLLQAKADLDPQAAVEPEDFEENSALKQNSAFNADSNLALMRRLENTIKMEPLIEPKPSVNTAVFGLSGGLASIITDYLGFDGDAFDDPEMPVPVLSFSEALAEFLGVYIGPEEEDIPVSKPVPVLDVVENVLVPAPVLAAEPAAEPIESVAAPTVVVPVNPEEDALEYDDIEIGFGSDNDTIDSDVTPAIDSASIAQEKNRTTIRI